MKIKPLPYREYNKTTTSPTEVVVLYSDIMPQKGIYCNYDNNRIHLACRHHSHHRTGYTEYPERLTLGSAHRNNDWMVIIHQP
jgi:hypothetical protein